MTTPKYLYTVYGESVEPIVDEMYRLSDEYGYDLPCLCNTACMLAGGGLDVEDSVEMMETVVEYSREWQVNPVELGHSLTVVISVYNVEPRDSGTIARKIDDFTDVESISPEDAFNVLNYVGPTVMNI